MFSTYIQNDPRFHQAYCTWGTDSLSAVKRSGHVVDPPISSTTEAEERVELYLYSMSSFMRGYRMNFTFYYVSDVLTIIKFFKCISPDFFFGGGD